ncbi:MAG: hypothetical protein JXA97_01805 [Anaerolineales bacterium]|nr:hypothetical protein [Anaerolineales bacterium]
MKPYHEIGRIVFAVIFLLGSIANSIILVTNPGLYHGFADLSILPFYREAWTRFVIPHPVFFVGLIILFELGLAFSLLYKGLYVRLGLLLAAIFMLFLVPFWWSGGGLLNLIFAVLLLWLARYSYPVASIRRVKHSAMKTDS